MNNWKFVLFLRSCDDVRCEWKKKYFIFYVILSNHSFLLTHLMSLSTIATRAEPSLWRVLNTLEPRITRRHKSDNEDGRKAQQSL